MPGRRPAAASPPRVAQPVGPHTMTDEPIRRFGIRVDFRWHERPRWLWRRHAARRCADLAIGRPFRPDPEAWLNGWTRRGTKVYIGNSLHCAGCGTHHGTFTIIITGDEPPSPERYPDWPFPRDTCPVHNQARPAPPLTAAERVAARGPLP